MPEDRIFTLKDFYFNLPEKQIAQYPTDKREESRLFVLDRSSGKHHNKMFYEIDQILFDDDVLVLNNARVIPCRMFFRRLSGGLVEIVLTRRLAGNKWLALSNRTKKLKNNEILISDVNRSINIRIISRQENSLEIETNTEFDDEIMKEIGRIPLPPYIRRETSDIDDDRYQTVYATHNVAAASPTAGLHFSNYLIERLKKKGIKFVYLTLNISWGTFQPVRENDLAKHKMHTEYFYLSEQSADEINSARKKGRRIIAVGTTSLRVLESTFQNGINRPMDGETNIFIYPPYRIESIDGLLTNFHTPYSTLLMLVSAFAGYDTIMDAYRTAVENSYRFFSYGDAMLIV